MLHPPRGCCPRGWCGKIGPVVRQYLQLGSRTLAYLDNDPEATGKPVLVLVHAFPLGSQMWEPQFRGAFHGWRLLAPDLRGFGGSTDERAEDVAPTIDDYADDVAGLIREVAGGPVVLGGLSLGGYVAFAVMRRAPGLVRALILADTRATADSLEGRAARKAMLTVLEHDGPQGVARDMMPRLLGATTREQNPDAEETVRLLIKRQSPAAIRDAIVRMMERPDSPRRCCRRSPCRRWSSWATKTCSRRRPNPRRWWRRCPTRRSCGLPAPVISPISSRGRRSRPASKTSSASLPPV